LKLFSPGNVICLGNIAEERKDLKMKLILRLVVNAVAIYIAVAILNGKGLTMDSGSWVAFIWLALIFAGVNALIKPVLTLLGCPFVILTLGLGTLLINTLMFYLTAMIGQYFNIGFYITSFWGAFFGSIIVSIVSVVLNSILRDR
jgi:putative membrane protein